MNYVVSIAIVLMLATGALAQNAQLSGTIRDTSDAVIPIANLTVINELTGVKRQTTSHDGYYAVPSLQPGRYMVIVQASGFQSISRQGVTLDVAQDARIDFTLPVGSMEQTITVSGQAVLLDTQDASVGTVVDRQFIANLPLNGRSFQSLVSLTPGVVITSASNASPGQFSINGQRPDANYFTIDGVSANVGINPTGSPGSGSSGSTLQTSASGGFNNLVSVDALQEFKIQTSTFAPEYGRLPGGQISIVTRGGTNEFHGTAFDYLRNSALDANNWFANRAGSARKPFRQNDFGGVFGGPILRNKLFFFGSYEGLRVSTPLFGTFSVPSAFVRSSPTTLAAIKPLLNTWPQPTNTPCAPATPAPTTCDQNLASWSGSYLDSSNLDAGSLRLDYSPTNRLTLFVRGNYSPSTVLLHTATVQSVQNAKITVQTWTAGSVFTFNPTLTNDFRFNYSHIRAANVGTFDSVGGGVPITPASDAATYAIMFPLAGYSPANSAFVMGLDSASVFIGIIANNVNQQYNVTDSVAKVHGNHQMKFGMDYRRLTPTVAAPEYQSIYTFQSGTAPAFNDPWVKGIPLSYQTTANPVKVARFENVGFYGQDTWKITQRLTLTYGLRWDVNPAPQGTSATPMFALSPIDPSNLGATTVRLGQPLYPTQWSALGPRLGFAYQLSRNANWGTVLRGGFGLFFDTGGDIANALRQAGSGNIVFNSGVVLPATPAQSALAPPLLAPPFALIQNTANPGLRLPYTHHVSAAVQQSLGQSQTVTLTYAGAVGRNLLRPEAFPPNVAMPQGYQVVGSTGTSDYHSLQTLFQRRLSHGLQVMAAYTWAHSLDDGSGANANAIPAASLGINDNRGPSDFDIRHSFQSAVSYDLPTPRSHAVVRAVAGGWGSDFIFRARTAPPVNLTSSRLFIGAVRPGNAGLRIPVRPNVVPGQPLYLYGADCVAAYGPTAPAGRRLLPAGSICPGGRGFNYNAFVDPPNTGGATVSQGSLSRNALRGFGWNQLDFTLRRDFRMTERMHLQFRSDFFNLLNHPAFGPPPGDYGTTGTFGVSGQALNNALGGGGSQGGYNPLYQIGGARSIQLSLKFIF